MLNRSPEEWELIRPIGDEKRVPDGLLWLRDVDHPCHAFAPGRPMGNCDSDGHYICQECVWLHPKKTPAGIAVLEDEWLENEGRLRSRSSYYVKR